jgi:hypothetical protein
MFNPSDSVHLGNHPGSIYLEGRLPIAVAATAAQLNLNDGQVVQATIEARPGGLGLRVGQMWIDLPMDLPERLRLSVGDPVTLKAQISASGKVSLRPFQPTLESKPTSSTDGLSIQQAQIQKLLFDAENNSSWMQLLQSDTLQQQASQFPQIQSLLQQWLGQQPSMALLSTDRLKRWMQLTGLFSENRLLQGLNQSLPDLKMILRALLNQKQLPDEIKDSLDDAKTAIESSQVKALHVTPGGAWWMTMLLSFQDASPISLRIGQEEKQTHQDKPPFVAQIHTINQDLGELWLRTRIFSGHEIDLTMWAARSDIAERAKMRSQMLVEELAGNGLRLNRIQVFHGQGPVDFEISRSPGSAGRMLDIQS